MKNIFDYVGKRVKLKQSDLKGEVVEITIDRVGKMRLLILFDGHIPMKTVSESDIVVINFDNAPMPLISHIINQKHMQKADDHFGFIYNDKSIADLLSNWNDKWRVTNNDHLNNMAKFLDAIRFKEASKRTDEFSQLMSDFLEKSEKMLVDLKLVWKYADEYNDSLDTLQIVEMPVAEEECHKAFNRLRDATMNMKSLNDIESIIPITPREKAINALHLEGLCVDKEIAHRQADFILCKFLKSLGYGDVVAAYENIEKDYSQLIKLKRF